MLEHARQEIVNPYQEAGAEVLEKEGMREVGPGRETGYEGAYDAGGKKDYKTGSRIQPEGSFPQESTFGGAMIEALGDKETAQEKEYWHGDLAAPSDDCQGIMVTITMACDDHNGGNQPDQVEVVFVSVLQALVEWLPLV